MGNISVREVSSFALALKKFASNFHVCPTVIKSRKFDVATKNSCLQYLLEEPFTIFSNYKWNLVEQTRVPRKG